MVSRELHWEPSKSHTNAFIRLDKIYFILKLVIKRGLELMASALGSTFEKEEVEVRFLPLASVSSIVLSTKD
jgi:hypothetical protein